MKDIKYIDLFAGIGGFRYGLERANKQFKCVWSNEWDKYAAQTYRKHYGEISEQDIREVKTADIPEHDLLCAGFPCQSFSVAGKRRGFEDTRGTLFFEIARIAKHKRPRYLLLENVKGLLSHDKGKTFQTIIGVLSDLGYRVEWQVLNSKHFGVPQNRERVFIIGHLGGESGQQVFPIRSTDKAVDKTKELPEQISNTLRTNYSNAHSNETYVGELEYEGAILSEENRKWLDDGKEHSRNFPQGQRVYSAEGVGSTLAGNAGGMGGKTGLYAIHDMRIRRLTPTECERLQGFPDGWTEGLSDTQRYKCLGNAVTTNVITAIGSQLVDK